MNVLQRTLISGLCVAAVPSSGFAQELFGRWDSVTSAIPTHISLYVSPGGGGFGTPASPFATITDALNLVQIIHSYPPLMLGTMPALAQITVNVAPGVYGPGETFPMDIPANGVSLETWSDGTTGPFDRAIIDSGAAGAAVRVAWIGNEGLPPTVIQGLDVTGFPAVLVDPDFFEEDPGEETLSVEIRDNLVAGAVGIELQTRTGYSSLYVVENNDIGRGGFETLNAGGIALFERCEVDASASTLYRSNRAQLYERILDISSDGVPVKGDLPCVPRVFSNIFQFAEGIVSITNCDTFLVNNTLAFAVNLGGNPFPTGLLVSGGSIEHHNNILWSPDPPVPGPYLAAAPIDQSFVGGVVFPMPPTTNIVLDLGGGPPAFVDGDALPVPFFAPMDLHLTPASVAAIGMGTNAMAIDPAMAVPGTVNTIRSWQFPNAAVAGDLLTVRTDVNLDNDLESRIHNSGAPGEVGLPPTIDIGGDEYRDLLPGGVARPARNGRIEFTDRLGMAPITQNALGNVISDTPMPVGTARTWTVDLFLDGPPGGLFVVYGGFGFFEDIADPVLGVMTQNGPVYQNLFLPVLALGSYALDLSTAVSLNVGGGVFDATGAAVLPLTFAMNDVAFVETEAYFQMATFDPATPAGRWSISNRVKVELDDRP